MPFMKPLSRQYHWEFMLIVWNNKQEKAQSLLQRENLSVMENKKTMKLLNFGQVPVRYPTSKVIVLYRTCYLEQQTGLA